MKTARVCHCLSALGQAVPRQSHLRPSQRHEHCFCEDSEAVAHLAFQPYSLRENDPHVTGIGRKPAGATAIATPIPLGLQPAALRLAARSKSRRLTTGERRSIRPPMLVQNGPVFRSFCPEIGTNPSRFHRIEHNPSTLLRSSGFRWAVWGDIGQSPMRPAPALSDHCNHFDPNSPQPQHNSDSRWPGPTDRRT